uniref:Uncharacterized protein n=1 Tax=Peronospora matthiolae TaxID=2874970 RepID=A0AAV1TWV4_9STRA
MDRPGPLLEHTALAELLGVEDVDFDSGSDIKVEGQEQSKLSTPMRGDIPHPAFNPFPERSAATALTALGAMPSMATSIITNPLDEEQQRMLDQAASAQRKSEVQTTLQRHSEFHLTWKISFVKRHTIRRRHGLPVQWEKRPLNSNIARLFERGTWNLL